LVANGGEVVLGKVATQESGVKTWRALAEDGWQWEGHAEDFTKAAREVEAKVGAPVAVVARRAMWKKSSDGMPALKAMLTQPDGTLGEIILAFFMERNWSRDYEWRAGQDKAGIAKTKVEAARAAEAAVFDATVAGSRQRDKEPPDDDPTAAVDTEQLDRTRKALEEVPT
jgi:hypothetical protein